MLKRTKIVATLGPASNSAKTISALISTGIDVVRLNFSHGDAQEHVHYATLLRKIAKKQNRYIAILGDLQGPKIRITRFKENTVILEKNQLFTFDLDLDSSQGTTTTVGITYAQLIDDCHLNQILLLDDGRITMKVKEKHNRHLICTVLQGGRLSNNKGINIQGGGLSAPALTEKDKEDIKLAAKIGVDYLAISFVRTVEDIKECRQLFKKSGGHGCLLAKIERAEVVASQKKLEEIIQASDAVMVARGDLGVEIGDAELVGVQKKIISISRRLNRPVITATQMMESMIQNSLPTRAEVFDVANAVLDGTDAVMLSAETATGNNPENVVSAMNRIVLGTEKQTCKNTDMIAKKMVFDFASTDETIAISAMYAANHLKSIKGIVCLTKTGKTAMWMSRINSSLPIIAFSRSEKTCRRMALYRGVYPLHWDIDPNIDNVNKETILTNHLKSFGFQQNDKVIFTFGGRDHATNTLKILVL